MTDIIDDLVEAADMAENFGQHGRAAIVCVDSYAGRQEHPCRVVGETQKRYRIMVDEPTALPPGFSILMPGYTKLVPKSAIRFIET